MIKPFYISSCDELSHHLLPYGLTTASVRIAQAIACADILINEKNISSENLGVMGISGGGLISLVRFRAGNDTFATCSVIGAAALGVSFIVNPSAMSQGGENLFFPIAILGLFFNTIGKILSAARIRRNFEKRRKRR